MTDENGASVPTAITPTSTFGAYILDEIQRGSHLLTMPFTLAPSRLDAGSTIVFSRFQWLSCDRGFIVGGLLDGALPLRHTS